MWETICYAHVLFCIFPSHNAIDEWTIRKECDFHNWWWLAESYASTCACQTWLPPNGSYCTIPQCTGATNQGELARNNQKAIGQLKIIRGSWNEINQTVDRNWMYHVLIGSHHAMRLKDGKMQGEVPPPHLALRGQRRIHIGIEANQPCD